MDLLNRVAEQWYVVPQPSDPIAQGDQFWGVVIRTVGGSRDGSVVVIPLEMDLVVLTQSCDLMYEKIDSVLCAPVHQLGDWIESNPADLSRLEDVRQGFDPSLYILSAWPASPYATARVDRIVDFANLRTIGFEILEQARETGSQRIALRSPAREHAAQAIARAFMRVGLPLDIPSFELERSGRQEAAFSTTPEISMLLSRANLVLTQPIPIVIGQRHRNSTRETYFLLITRLPEHHPQIVGAGLDLPQAQRSFARQLLAAWTAARDGSTRRAWLRDYLAAAS